jgi:type IV pilus assembly protein PilE
VIKAHGFTLIEVMVVIVIIGIIMSLAIPSYSSYLVNSRRLEAHTMLLDVSAKLESFMAQDGTTYTKEFGSSGLRISAIDSTVLTSPSNYYEIKIDAGECGTIVNCYVVTATPSASGPQSNDADCTSISLSSTGAKRGNPEGNDCW